MGWFNFNRSEKKQKKGVACVSSRRSKMWLLRRLNNEEKVEIINYLKPRNGITAVELYRRVHGDKPSTYRAATAYADKLVHRALYHDLGIKS